MVPLLNPASLKSYFLWLFNSPVFENILSDTTEDAYIPSSSQRLNGISSFSANSGSTLKAVEQHSLTKEQYDRAYLYLMSENTALLSAAHLIEIGIGLYLDALFYNSEDLFKNPTTSGYSELIADSIKTLAGTLWLSPVTQELLPILAYHCSKDDIDKGMGAGLSACFGQRGAFDSFANGERMTCPIKKSIAHLLNMAFEQDTAGQWVEAKPQHGGILLSLATMMNTSRMQTSFTSVEETNQPKSP